MPSPLSTNQSDKKILSNLRTQNSLTAQMTSKAIELISIPFLWSQLYYQYWETVCMFYQIDSNKDKPRYTIKEGNPRTDKHTHVLYACMHLFL